MSRLGSYLSVFIKSILINLKVKKFTSTLLFRTILVFYVNYKCFVLWNTFKSKKPHFGGLCKFSNVKADQDSLKICAA